MLRETKLMGVARAVLDEGATSLVEKGACMVQRLVFVHADEVTSCAVLGQVEQCGSIGVSAKGPWLQSEWVAHLRVVAAERTGPERHGQARAKPSGVGSGRYESVSGVRGRTRRGRRPNGHQP